MNETQTELTIEMLPTVEQLKTFLNNSSYGKRETTPTLFHRDEYDIRDEYGDPHSKKGRLAAKQAIKHFGLKKEHYKLFIMLYNDRLDIGTVKERVSHFYEAIERCEICQFMLRVIEDLPNYWELYQASNIKYSEEDFYVYYWWTQIYFVHTKCKEKLDAYVRMTK